MYGPPRPRPHVRALCERSGFRHTGDTGDTGVILLARTADPSGAEPYPGGTVERTPGECGTRFTARTDAGTGGCVETGTSLTRPGRHPRGVGLADTADPRVEPAHPGRGRQRRLFGRAADWLWLCGTGRVPAREPVEGTAGIERLVDAGFHGPTRTDGGGEHRCGLADTADPRVEPAHPGRGRQRRLFGRAADRLWLCGPGRVPARELAEGTAGIERLLDAAFHGPTRVDRGGEHHPHQPDPPRTRRSS
ncbi:hypothetical protein ACWCPX_43580 [Streptomyces olivaceoviridis]